METISQERARMRRRSASWLALTLSVAACAAGAPAPGVALQPSAAGSPALASMATRATVDARGVKGSLAPDALLSDAGNNRQNLIGVDWEIPPGSEHYLCARLLMPDDVYVSAYYPLNPPGTHHTALTLLDKPNARDGVTECDISEVGTHNLGGSASGTMGGPLPDGVALKFARGSQILLNLHLLNATDHAIGGRSGAQVVTTQADAVKVLADGVAVGPLKLTVPPGHSVQTGVCTVDHDYTIFNVLPHMHQTGVNMRVVARHAGSDVLLHDGPFDFYEQTTYALTPLALTQGDTITLECTYENTTERVLHFGESSNDEMCIAGLARYPAGGKSACPY